MIRNALKWIEKNYIIVILAILVVIAPFIGAIIGKNSSSSSSLDSVNIGDTVMNKGKVLTFEYNKHKYINIVKIDNDGNANSYLLHDPNCTCLSRKLNNITTVITNTDNDNSKSSDSINKANYKAILNALAELRNDNKKLHNQLNAVYDVAKKPRIIYRTVTKTVYVSKKRRR